MVDVEMTEVGAVEPILVSELGLNPHPRPRGEREELGWEAERGA